jgi:hypothetical protein
MATKRKGGRGQFSPYTNYVIEGGRIQMVNLDTYVLACAEDHTSHLAFMHDTGFLTIFN